MFVPQLLIVLAVATATTALGDVYKGNIVHGLRVTAGQLVLIESSANCTNLQVTTNTKTSTTTLINGCSTIPTSATEGKIGISGCPIPPYDQSLWTNIKIEVIWAQINTTHGLYAKGNLASFGVSYNSDFQKVFSGSGTVYNVTVAPFNKLVC